MTAAISVHCTTTLTCWYASTASLDHRSEMKSQRDIVDHLRPDDGHIAAGQSAVTERLPCPKDDLAGKPGRGIVACAGRHPHVTIHIWPIGRRGRKVGRLEWISGGCAC